MISQKSKHAAKAAGSGMGAGHMRRLVSAMLAVLLLLALFPARNAYAAEGSLLELSIQAGSTSATVNGKPVTIQQPFSENGTLMVPLGIFKKAFGSTVSLEGEDVVKVMYGPHTGAMTIGGTTAWKDGVKIKLAAPPRMVSGVLMVPLRFVAGVLGARVTPAGGGGIRVTLAPSLAVTAVDTQGGIDSDIGKTRIGNSYLTWSMNYPPGLVVGDSGGDEGVATFTSAENDYYLEVHASPLAVPLDPEGLLENLVGSSQEGGEIVLDRETVPEARTPYARTVSKDSSGALWEGRQYYANGRLYEIYLTDDKAANYKDLGKYAALLNSFQPSFNTSDSSIRDLSTIHNGLREAYNDDYGIALKVPADWSADDQQLYYTGKQGSYLRVKVSSAPAGSTLASWNQELQSQLQDTYVSEAYTSKDSVAGKVSGEPVLINELGLNPGNGWNTEYQILLLKNGYRYFFEYVAASSQPSDKERFTDVLNSIDIDFAQTQENFGRLEVEDYPLLSTKLITKTSKAYGYKIDIPRLWTPVQDLFESQTIEYRFTGGRFQFYASPEVTPEYALSQLQSYYLNTKKDPKGPQVKSVAETAFAGVPATILTIEQIKNSIPVGTKIIIFSKNDVVYTLTVTLNAANATASQQATLERVLGSFGWAGE
ncbi:copper amine oxidase N-terminal domain-containing protein [Paenibacillus tritici]|uniref:copper amine oxidase N-terminal domain-containing protein n=1 Tax=Paenibacillus tritici TaxID=1873425 RepID=UPI001BA743E9|nr:copper amine oxidase N-terminal domain-containing protein [Paenibacillus tritici]QUL54491.1 copper amine oxidase N-terminal domain-containing protein [Paenibacillus tritici]